MNKTTVTLTAHLHALPKVGGGYAYSLFDFDASNSSLGYIHLATQEVTFSIEVPNGTQLELESLKAARLRIEEDAAKQCDNLDARIAALEARL